MNKHLHHVGWGVQTMVVLLLSVRLGRALDNHWQCTQPWCLGSLSLLSTVGCLYTLVKRLLQRGES